LLTSQYVRTKYPHVDVSILHN